MPKNLGCWLGFLATVFFFTTMLFIGLHQEVVALISLALLIKVVIITFVLLYIEGKRAAKGVIK